SSKYADEVPYYPLIADPVTAGGHPPGKRQQCPLHKAAERNRKASKRIAAVTVAPPVSLVPFCAALLGCFQAQHQHVEDDPEVDGENQKANPVGLSQQISYFERDVDGARGDGQPLRPGAYVPQAVGFDEAKDYVDRRYHGYLPQADVADPVHEIDKDTNEVVVGIGMENIPRPARTTTTPLENSQMATVRTPLMCSGSSILGCGIMGCIW